MLIIRITNNDSSYSRGRKILDHSIAMFETVYPNKNTYLVNSDQPLQFIKSKHKHIIACTYGSKQYDELLKDTSRYKAVIFHDLIHPYKWALAQSLPANLHLHWFCYGSELYSIPYLRDQLYLPLTKKTIIHTPSTQMKNWLEEQSPIFYNLFYKTLKGQETIFSLFKKAVERCQSFSSPIEDEILYVKKYLNNNIEYIPFHHITLEKIVSNVKNEVCTTQHFLVGNSANPTNNHLDTFQVLSESKITQEIYVPLSYPKNDLYIAKVKQSGVDFFGEQFKPLIHFMPMEDYSNILKKCGNVVMNFNRQQGIANIVLALHLGAKVYLNSNNISYNYLKRLGLKFYHINELHANFDTNNSEELAQHNRIILEKMYAENVVIETTQQLVTKLVQ